MNIDPKTPAKRDWIAARATCSIGHLWAVLLEAVDSDVKSADSRADEQTRFRKNSPNVDKLIVIRERDMGGIIEDDGIVFERLPDGIAVKESHSQKRRFTATPTVDVISGDCLFLVENQPMYAWQVSQRALESLFFKYGLSPKANPNN